MPVLRKRERAQANIGYSPVSARGNPMTDVVRQNAGMLAQKAADYARAMTVEAEETAKALAKAAVFNTNEAGLPELPDNLAAKMGNAARRAYDATIETRFVHHMTTSVKMRLAEIANRNSSDPEAFIAEAEGELSEMAATVPDGYGGAFQEIATGQLVDHASTIGYRQGVALAEERKGDTGTLIETVLSGVIEEVRVGDVDKAVDKMQGLVDFIEAQPMNIMSRGEKDAAIEDVFYQVGLARLIEENDLIHASPAELAAIHASLVAGDDPELAAYFMRPGSKSPDQEQMVRAGQHVMQLMGAANDRAAAERKQATDQIAKAEIRAGYRSGTGEEKRLLDEDLSAAVKFRDETGKLRVIAPEDWLYADEQTRANMLQAVKEAGFAPESLEMLFRKLSKSSDPEELWRGVLLYRDLREQTTADGTKVNLTGIVDARLVGLFDAAESLHGGGEPSMESVEHAILMVANMEDDRWTPENFADKLNSETGFVAGLFKSAITPETLGTAITEIVSSEVFEENGIVPRAEDQKAAETNFKLYLEMGHDVEAATEKVRQQFMEIYVESPAMGGLRDANAPERHFSMPAARTFTEAVGNVLDDIGTSVLGAEYGLKEWLAEAPNAVIPNFMGTYDVNYGADWLTAETWELIANSEIGVGMAREGIDKELLLAGVAQKGNFPRFLKPGRDYILKFDGYGKANRPIYRVFLKTKAGGMVPMKMRLDMSAEFDKVTKLSEEAALYEQEKKRRERDGAAAREWGGIGGPLGIDGLEDDPFDGVYKSTEFWLQFRKKNP